MGGVGTALRTPPLSRVDAEHTPIGGVEGGGVHLSQLLGAGGPLRQGQPLSITRTGGERVDGLQQHKARGSQCAGDCLLQHCLANGHLGQPGSACLHHCRIGSEAH